MTTEIPGLFDSRSHHSIGPAAPISTNAQIGDGVSKSILDGLLAEKGALGPNFVNSNRLLDEEIAKVKSGSKEAGKAYYMMDGSRAMVERIYVPMNLQREHNLVGRLLGPKGMTLKAIQNESRTKISILGRGSIKDRKKEDELRNSTDVAFAHLKDDLHVQIEAAPPFSNMKMAAGVAEINKMLIPPVPGQPDTLLARYLDPQLIEGYAATGGPPRMQTPPSPRGHGGRGGMHPGGRGRGRGGGGGGGRGRGGGRGGRMMDHGGRGRGGGPPPRSRPIGNPYIEGSWRDGRGGEGSRPPMGEEFGREGRERMYREERRSLGDYGRPSESFSGDSEPYFSFSDKPVRSSSYGRESIISNDYHHGASSEWKAPRPGRREPPRHHPYASGGGEYF